MGTKTEIINLLADMPDDAQKEALEFVRGIAKNFSDNEKQRKIENLDKMKKAVKEYNRIIDEEDLAIEEIYSSRERNPVDERNVNFD